MRRHTLLPNGEDELDFGWSWDTWLPVGDTLAASTWNVPAGLSLISQGNDTINSSAFFKDQSGAVGTRYEVTNNVVSAGGRKTSRTFIIQIVAKKYD